MLSLSCLLVAGVALRKESVDRNPISFGSFGRAFLSLSARRAWIEILTDDVSTGGKMSLSARRAWIEIVCFNVIGHSAHVALRKESVDRNHGVCLRLF